MTLRYDYLVPESQLGIKMEGTNERITGNFYCLIPEKENGSRPGGHLQDGFHDGVGPGDDDPSELSLVCNFAN